MDQAKTPNIRSPKRFLFRVAKKITLNGLTRSSVTGYLKDLIGPDTDSGAVSLQEQAHSEFHLEVFAHAVAILPTPCRRVFMMRKLHGLSPAEIAEELGISVSTVETHLSTGLLKCAEFMEARGHGVWDLRIIDDRLQKRS